MVGEVACWLQMLEELSRVHIVFHVSQLHKYIFDPTHVIEPNSLQLKKDLTYDAQPI